MGSPARRPHRRREDAGQNESVEPRPGESAKGGEVGDAEAASQANTESRLADSARRLIRSAAAALGIAQENLPGTWEIRPTPTEGTVRLRLTEFRSSSDMPVPLARLEGLTAAQLAGFYARKYNLLGGDFVGFGGMDEIRFRGPVFPNCRFIIMAKLASLRPNRRATFDFQGVVEDRIVFTGSMIGVPIERDQKID